MDKKVLTIQDISCYGQCSLTVALPIISACGIETAIVPSAVLSTHTGGFKGFTFRDLSDDLPGIGDHWKTEGIKFDAIYTGYLGSYKQMKYIEEIMSKVLKDGALKIIDPAMADNGVLYTGFDDKYVQEMVEFARNADIFLPNITEAAFMTGIEYRADNHDEAYIMSLLHKLASFGIPYIVLKGISYKADELGVAVYDAKADKVEYYFTKKIEKSSHGTGDCYASVVTGALMRGKSLYEAAQMGADFVVACIKATMDDDTHWYGVKFEKALPELITKLSK